MIHRKILDKAGCTTERLEEIFTAEREPDSKMEEFMNSGGTGETPTEFTDGAIRTRLEKRIQSRIEAGLRQSARLGDFYNAIDRAWDSTPINKEVTPLLLLAQGKIKEGFAAEWLKRLNCADKFCDKDDKGEITGINVPKLWEVNFNLIRSYVTRRVAAQTTRSSNAWPYFNYEARSQNMADKFRAKVVSTRVDVMADQFNYRHYFAQTYRDLFLYARSLSFPKVSWTKVESPMLVPERRPAVAEEGEDDIRFRVDGDRPSGTPSPPRTKTEKVVLREGIDFVNPHPLSCFWDPSEPLANINTDTGPGYLGYYRIAKYSEVLDNPELWNRTSVEKSSQQVANAVGAHAVFFNHFYNTEINSEGEARIIPGELVADLSSKTNARESNVGVYEANHRDAGLVFSHYYEKVNPKNEGIGDLDADVWMHLLVASDHTVVWGEFLTTIPAFYGGINEADSRYVSPSMAHDLLGFQDQLTNILSQLLRDMKVGMIQLWLVNKDIFDEEEQEYLRKVFDAGDMYVEPKLAMASFKEMRDLGISVDQMVKVVEANVGRKITEAFEAIERLLGLTERLMIMSPQEVGQAAQRTISASESVAMNESVSAMYSFISDSIDEQRSAAKKLVYESLVCELDPDEPIKVPGIGSFTEETIREAGFAEEGGYLVGHPVDLITEYAFTSRDGEDRFSDAKGADALSNLLGQVLPDQELRQVLGKKRMVRMLNEVFRLSGARENMKIELTEQEETADEPGTGPDPGAGGGLPPEVLEAIERVVEATETLDQRLDMVEEQTGARTPAELGGTGEGGGEGEPSPSPAAPAAPAPGPARGPVPVTLGSPGETPVIEESGEEPVRGEAPPEEEPPVEENPFR